MAIESKEKQKAEHLLTELNLTGYPFSEWAAQFLASCIASGADWPYVLNEVGEMLTRTQNLAAHEEHIWMGLLPGGTAHNLFMTLEAGAEFPHPTTSEQKPNVKLDYDLTVHVGGDVFFCPSGAEFFLDEHGVQWVKFYPTNGPAKNEENIIRTDATGFGISRKVS